MGCYKMPKIISKIKSYATRPPMKTIFRSTTHPMLSTAPDSASTPPVPNPALQLLIV